jgi:hypothetical protein
MRVIIHPDKRFPIAEASLEGWRRVVYFSDKPVAVEMLAFPGN